MSGKEKLEQLKSYLSELGSLAVAYSGGVDSTFLLKVAHDVLGDSAIAVTARSPVFPERELTEAVEFCQQEGITHIICDLDVLAIEGFSENPPNRCYLCKSELISGIRSVADACGIKNLADGSNVDDEGDYRPGLQALKEHDIISPLRHVGLSKSEIRELSRELGLLTWDKPSFACLASRIPYGELITSEKLAMIDKAEQFLLNSGFIQVRVRHHGELARIETDSRGFELLRDPELRHKIYDCFKQIGFKYTASDLLGYRTGSMNEAIG